MVDVRKVRGGTGLDSINDEIDEILDSVFENTRQATEAFFVKYDENPDPMVLARWLEPRAWREIDYVFLLNEQIRRYGLAFERKHITLLAKQSFQEAEHYEMVGKAIESLGGTVPTETPPEAKQWSEWLWNCSEHSASGSFAPTFAAGERHGFDEVVRVYKRIEIDEKFHVGLGRQVLSAYATTDEDREEILRAYRGMRDIAWKTFTPESVASAVR
jgi:hypothetical protein